MSNTNLRFQRINNSTIGSFEFTQGTIYFNDADNLIYVGTGNGTGTSNYKVYSGARDINWDNANSILSFTNASGTSVSIDFDNLVGFDDFTALRDGIGLVESKVGDVSVYSFGPNGIAGTEYLDSSDSSTVIGALKTLDDAVKVARQNAGVTSFAGKTGAITIKTDNTATGTINFSINDSSMLSASIVDPSSAAYKTVEYFVGGANDTSANNTIKGAINYTKDVLGTTNDTSAAITVHGAIQKVEDVKTELIGTSGDASTVITIHGVQKKAEAVKTELLGTDSDSSAMVTIYGVQQKAEDIFGKDIDSSTAKTIEGLVKKTDAMETNAALHLYSGESGSTTADTVTANGQIYRLVQGETTIAKFNIEKDSFVSDGSVVKHDTSSEPWGPAGTYIQLALRTTDTSTGTSSEKTIYIPAESLVDSYTEDNTGKNVTVTVDNTTNKISAEVSTSDGTHLVQHNNTEVTLATIAGQTVNAKIASLENTADDTAGGVKITETVTSGNAELNARIVDGAVTTAKIVDGNVTEAKLSSDVSTKLNGAVQTVTGETAISDPNDDYINVKVSAAKIGTDVSLSTTYSLTTHDVSTATSSSNGLADASTVKTYVQTYVGEQLTWSAWPEA